MAAFSVTFRHLCPDEKECGRSWPELAEAVRRAAVELTARIGGHPTG
jgi:hypothetical protein